MSQTRVAQYLNEIVSLTIMGLMILALAAGRAGADVGQQVRNPAQAADEPAAELVIAVDFSIRHEGE